MRSPRSLALLAASALVLAACGGDDTTSGGDALTTPVPATAAPEVSSDSTRAASTTEPSSGTPDTEPVTTPARQTTQPANTPSTPTAPARPHAVAHAMGTTEVPADVARIVVLDSSFLDAAIALGVPPVGATEGTPGSGLPAYLGEAIADIEIAGDTTAPNLEAVAALRPDVILGAKVRHESLYGQLTAIAPTVFSESSGQDWTAQVRLTAEVLGATDRADDLLAAFSERAASVGAAIGSDGHTARIVRFTPGQTRVYGPTTFSGSVLTAVGFDLSGTDTGLEYDPAYGMALVSAEQFELLDSDVIFATGFADEGSARADFESVWATLPAVAGGKLFAIEDGTWMTGIGVIGANMILDDLEAWLAG